MKSLPDGNSEAERCILHRRASIPSTEYARNVGKRCTPTASMIMERSPPVRNVPRGILLEFTQFCIGFAAEETNQSRDLTVDERGVPSNPPGAEDHAAVNMTSCPVAPVYRLFEDIVTPDTVPVGAL